MLLLTIGLLGQAACTDAPSLAATSTPIAAPGNTRDAPPEATETSIPPATQTQPTTAAPTASVTPEPTTAAAETPTPTPCPVKPDGLPTLLPQVAPLDIAYLSEGNVWLWTEAEAGAEPLAILDRIRNVQLSGDGELVALVRGVGDGEELWVIDRDGTGERRLMSVEEMRGLVVEPLAAAIVTEQLDWVTARHVLAFNSRPLILGLPERRYDDLRLINVDDGSRPLWLPPGEGGAFSFSWDGRHAALWQPGELRLVDIDGQVAPERAIRYVPEIDLASPPEPAWAQDSASLRVALPGEMGVFSIWEMMVGAGEPVVLDEKVGLPNSAAISPNLLLTAYVRPGVNERELHIAAIDGSWDIVYDAGPLLEFKGWAHDGQHFAYQMVQDERGRSTAFVGALCAARVPFQPALADGVSRPVLVWVDGERFVYVSGEPFAWELRLGNTAGDSELLAEMNHPEPVFDLAGDR